MHGDRQKRSYTIDDWINIRILRKRKYDFLHKECVNESSTEMYRIFSIWTNWIFKDLTKCHKWKIHSLPLRRTFFRSLTFICRPPYIHIYIQLMHRIAIAIITLILPNAALIFNLKIKCPKTLRTESTNKKLQKITHNMHNITIAPMSFFYMKIDQFTFLFGLTLKRTNLMNIDSTQIHANI